MNDGVHAAIHDTLPVEQSVISNLIDVVINFLSYYITKVIDMIWHFAIVIMFEILVLDWMWLVFYKPDSVTFMNGASNSKII